MAKAKRTAAQKRATKKLVAMNKRRSAPKRKAAKRKAAPKRKTAKNKRKSSSSNSRTRSNSMRKTSVKSILSSKTLQKVALGVGGGAIATLAIGAIAPQFSRFAGPAGAFALGGIEGLIGNIGLQMVGQRIGGGTTAQNASPQMEVL